MKKRLIAIALILSMILHLFPENTVKAIDTRTAGQSCGDNLIWDYADGTLTISGTGSMYDYETVNHYVNGITTNVPWEQYMNNIRHINIGSGVTYIGDCAFADCVNVESVKWASSLKEIGDKAFARCLLLSEVTIPEGVEVIGEWVFAGCTGMKKVIFPSTLTEIKKRAFSACSALESVNLPEGLTTLGDEAFITCDDLKTVSIPSTLTEISTYCFSSCESLTEVSIAEGPQKIEEEAFSYCKSLKTINIPESITLIEDEAFKKCTSLWTVNYAGNKDRWSEITIGSDNEYLQNAVINYGKVNPGEEGLPVITMDDYYKCQVGDTITISATCTSDTKPVDVSWKCANADAVTFSESAISSENANTYVLSTKVTAQLSGTYKITVTADGTEKSAFLVIEEVPMPDVYVKTDLSQYYCAMGQKFKVTVTMTTKDSYVAGSHKYICWLEVWKDNKWTEMSGWYDDGGITDYLFTLNSNNFAMGDFKFRVSVFETDNYAEQSSIYEHFFNVKFIDSSYNLTLDANGGNCELNSMPVVYNCEYGELPVPDRTGYTFMGWYTEPVEGTKVTDDMIVTQMEDHTLYAHWKGNQYTVILNAGRGTCQPTSSFVIYGDAYSILDTVFVSEVQGYVFDGWYTSPDGGEKITAETKVSIPADHVLYARWTEIKKPEIYTITYDANGGSGAPEEQFKTEGVDLKLRTEKPTRSGYRFLGWSTSSTATKAAYQAGGTYCKDASDILYAVWYKYKTQTITASSKKVTYGSKAFYLNAKTSGNGKLSYTSSNKMVATVSAAGKITVKGYGKTTIKITAAATTTYKKGTKSITITVVPKKGVLLTVSSPSAKKISVKWKTDTTVTGYQMYISRSSSFSKQTVQRTYKKSVGSMSLKGLTSKKYYYVKIRSYKNIDGKRYYGAWSTVKKVKVK